MYVLCIKGGRTIAEAAQLIVRSIASSTHQDVTVTCLIGNVSAHDEMERKRRDSHLQVHDLVANHWSMLK